MWLLGKAFKDFFSFLGVDKMVKYGMELIGEECECTKREESFNNLSYRLLLLLMPKRERTRQEEKMRMILLNNPKFRDMIGEQYEKYTGQRYTRQECPSCNLSMISKLYANPKFQEEVLKPLDVKLSKNPVDTIQQAIVKIKPEERKVKKAIVNLNKKPTNKVKPRKRKVKK